LSSKNYQGLAIARLGIGGIGSNSERSQQNASGIWAKLESDRSKMHRASGQNLRAIASQPNMLKPIREH